MSFYVIFINFKICYVLWTVKINMNFRIKYGQFFTEENISALNNFANIIGFSRILFKKLHTLEYYLFCVYGEAVLFFLLPPSGVFSNFICQAAACRNILEGFYERGKHLNG